MTVLEPTIDRPPPAPQPGYARGLLFRFGFLYWTLFCVQVLAGNFEDFGFGVGRCTSAWNAMVRWVGRALLSIPQVDTTSTGSGDRTADWIGLLVVAVVAAVGSLAWSLIDRKRRHDDRLRAILRVIVRYALAFVMLAYGFAKIFVHQFPAPATGRLLQTYGASSPMGLLWTFMGASPAYVFFSGAAETLGAALLLFRRTTTLGALVLFAVLTNVVLLNFCYDVPVKINSTHYLAMCVLLLLPDLRRLFDVLVLHRPTQPSLRPLELPHPWMRVTRRIVKYGAIALVSYTLAKEEMRGVGPDGPKTWYADYWNVTSFVRDGQPAPAIVDDASLWQRIKFEAMADGTNYVRWHNMDGSYGDLYTAEIDEAKGSMRFVPATDVEKPAHPTGPIAFAFTHHGDELTLTGTISGHTLAVSFHRLVLGDMLLTSRGFHWISEEPFNR